MTQSRAPARRADPGVRAEWTAPRTAAVTYYFQRLPAKCLPARLMVTLGHTDATAGRVTYPYVRGPTGRASFLVSDDGRTFDVVRVTADSKDRIPGRTVSVRLRWVAERPPDRMPANRRGGRGCRLLAPGPDGDGLSRGIQVLIPPDALKRKDTRPGWHGGPDAFMRRVLETDHGGGLYRKRQGMIEPVFADTKFNRRIDRFQRRGRSACRSEWRLITATHNLLKLFRHQMAPAAA